MCYEQTVSDSYFAWNNDPYLRMLFNLSRCYSKTGDGEDSEIVKKIQIIPESFNQKQNDKSGILKTIEKNFAKSFI